MESAKATKKELPEMRRGTREDVFGDGFFSQSFLGYHCEVITTPA